MENILIVPGLYGSELQHWQTWIENKLPNTLRVEQEDWDNPIFHLWSDNVLKALMQKNGKSWIIAHSFGCLISIYAAMKCPEKVAGAMLVALANPARFNTQGFVGNSAYLAATGNISAQLPKQALPFPSVIIASNNDPWMPLAQAEQWADVWESRFINVGAAGHINVASGHGAWSQGLAIFNELRATQTDFLEGFITDTVNLRLAHY